MRCVPRRPARPPPSMEALATSERRSAQDAFAAGPDSRRCGFSAPQKCKTALHYASAGGAEDVVQLLLSCSASTKGNIKVRWPRAAAAAPAPPAPCSGAALQWTHAAAPPN